MWQVNIDVESKLPQQVVLLDHNAMLTRNVNLSKHKNSLICLFLRVLSAHFLKQLELPY